MGNPGDRQPSDDDLPETKLIKKVHFFANMNDDNRCAFYLFYYSISVFHEKKRERNSILSRKICCRYRKTNNRFFFTFNLFSFLCLLQFFVCFRWNRTKKYIKNTICSSSQSWTRKLWCNQTVLNSRSVFMQIQLMSVTKDARQDVYFGFT